VAAAAAAAGSGSVPIGGSGGTAAAGLAPRAVFGSVAAAGHPVGGTVVTAAAAAVGCSAGQPAASAGDGNTSTGGAGAQPTASQCNSCMDCGGELVGEWDAGGIGGGGGGTFEAEVESAEPQVSGASNTVPSAEASTAQRAHAQRGGGGRVTR